MNIIIFTDSPKLKILLTKNRLQIEAFSTLNKYILSVNVPTLIYIDIGTLHIAIDKLISKLRNNKLVFLGLIDSINQIKKPIQVMQKGIVDIIPAKDISSLLNKSHIKKVITYIRNFRNISEHDILDNFTNHSILETESTFAQGWEDIEIGKNYTFGMLFIELDERDEMIKRYDSVNLGSALEIFHLFIDRNVTAFGGRIWIWSNFGGIALFPINVEKFKAVLCGLKILLYKFLHDVEESRFPNFISFRLAAHIGNIIYQEKSKGEVVSDSLNSVFHIGQENAEPGNFYITEDIFSNLSSKLKSYFKDFNVFEGRRIYRIRLPIL